MLRLIYFPLALAFIGATVLVFGTLACVARLLRLPQHARDVIMHMGCKGLLFGMRARPFALGWHSQPSSWPAEAVWVANHESFADAPSLIHILACRSVRFVAKKQLFWIPVFGWALYALGMVPVARRGRREDVTRLNATPRGRDLVFFAEGTRSRTGHMQPFKKGAVAYAMHHGLPLMPVAVVGGYECLRPRTLRLRGGHVAVVVGVPIPTAGCAAGDRDRLLAQVHTAVRALRAQALSTLDLQR